MLRQIQYFQSVVRNNSFSEAAEECHISQSAVSQQIQALERELGFQLLERKNRKFTLTPAGEHFYHKSLVLMADFERICAESAKIARGANASLRIGSLRGHSSAEIDQSVQEFAARYPDVELEVRQGNHEELYAMLRAEEVDLVLNDQRRAFSEEYYNLVLAVEDTCIEISTRSPFASLPSVSPQDLKNTPCILISSVSQQDTEEEYYRTIVGFQGQFLFAENLEAARMMVISGKGFMPVNGVSLIRQLGTGLCRVPLCRGTEPIRKPFCAFWKKDNSGYYVEEFAQILQSHYHPDAK